MATIPPMRFQGWQQNDKAAQKKFKRFLQMASVKSVMKQLPTLHREAEEKFPCLECGNCCRNYSPRFKTPDIKRIAKLLKMKEGAFIETYLKIDEDGDYVTHSAPCPFLGSDNHCSIYNHRPGDCRRFPYTDEDVLVKRKNITLKNSSFCPRVHHVLTRLVEESD